MLILPFGFSLTACAEEAYYNPPAKEETDEVYKQQMEETGVSELFSQLPEDVRQSLVNAGIDSPDYNVLSAMDFGKILNEICRLTVNEAATPFGALIVCIGIMILCSMIEGFKLSLGSSMGSICGTVGTLCVCTVVVVPLCSTIAELCEVISGASSFMLFYIPIMAGLMATSGQPITGAAYYTAMMSAGQAISLMSSKVFLPVLNIFMGVSVASSVSPRMNLSSLCDLLYKVLKWIMTLSMSIFVSILTFQSMITKASDGTAGRVMRFAVSSFVPVVGGALGEALSSVRGGLQLLKSGAGVFAIFGTAFFFFPILFRCILWIFALNFSASVGDLFDVKQISKLLRSASKAVSTMTAVLLCVMTVFILTTVIILLIGGGG